jgi:hemerythrin
MNDFCACFLTLPLAQGVPDISSVEAGFVKSWMIMLGFALMLGLQVWQGVRGSQVQRRDVSGTLTTVPEKRHADQSEVEELKKAVDALRQENQAQHQAAAVSGQNRVAALSTVLDTETTALSEKIDAVRDRVLEKIEEGFKTLTDNMNAIALKSERHDAVLPPLVVRVQELERKHSEAVGKIHERINDFLSKHPSPTKR